MRIMRVETVVCPILFNISASAQSTTKANGCDTSLIKPENEFSDIHVHLWEKIEKNTKKILEVCGILKHGSRGGIFMG